MMMHHSVTNFLRQFNARGAAGVFCPRLDRGKIPLLPFFGCRMMIFAMTFSHLTAQESPLPQPKLKPLPHPDLPKPILTEPGLPLWIVIAISLIGVVLIAVVVTLLLHRRKASVVPPEMPLSRATQRLKQLLAECSSIPPDEVGHRVSVIVREYQQACYSVPAPYRTREELYKNSALTKDETLRARFEPLAEFCDRLAFAPAPSLTAQAEALIQSALDAMRLEPHSRQVP